MSDNPTIHLSGGHRFDLGKVMITPGALDALKAAQQAPFELIQRHASGDWGDLTDEDKRENDISVKQGYLIFSIYNLKGGGKVWIITEADRSATTMLLPSEYDDN